MFFLPETKGISLEDMVSHLSLVGPEDTADLQDILFGLITKEQRQADIEARARQLVAADETEKIENPHHEEAKRELV